MRNGYAVRMALVLSALFACTGCDLAANVWRSPEERINEAFPVSTAAANARAKLETLLGASSAPLAAFQSEYADKLKLRGLSCAAGFQPGAFQAAADIRSKLDKPQCFADFDNEMAQWLSLRRTALLLAATPLRPIPTKPLPIITASNGINAVSFAETAGVALVTSHQALEIIDLGNDRSIYLDDQTRSYSWRATLAPNGRVFAVASQSGGAEGVRLRESTTGEVLVEFPDFQFFEWLDSATAWVTRRNGRGSELLDIASGKTVPLKGISSVPTQLLRLTDAAEPTFIARSHGSISKFTLRREGDQPQIVLLTQQTTPTMSWSAAISNLTSDGRFFVQGSGTLTISDLTTQQTQQIVLTPFSVQTISPLPEAGQVLLAVPLPYGRWSSQQLYIFDASDNTFAPVEDERFALPPGSPVARTVFVQPLKRVGLISGATIKLVDEVKHGFKLGQQAFLQLLQEQDGQLRQKADAAVAAAGNYRFDGTYPSTSVTGPSATGNIAELAKDAQIEAVGIYQSAAAPSRPGQPAGRGPVTVLVRKSPKPIVLVLASYDPVDWRVHVDPRAQLKAVLLSGYSDSTVQGAENLRTLQMGRTYAYEQGSSEFAQLQREVARWTGRPIDTFQGNYKALSFTVGEM